MMQAFEAFDRSASPRKLKDPIGLYVAASGPRARRLTARLGAGWIATTADVASGAATLDEMRSEWAAAGHEPDALDAVVLTGGVVLEEGEPADSPRAIAQTGPRAIAQAGPRAAMLLHRAADAALLGWPAIAAIPPAVADSVASYVELAQRFRPQGAPYLENHRGHLMFVKPEERPFVTAELIRLTTFAATDACDGSWMSVSTGSWFASPTARRMRQPSASPGPRKLRIDVRLALS